MRRAEFHDSAHAFTAHMDSIMTAKNRDYADDDSDALSNFKRMAAATGSDPLVVWFIFFSKHYDSIAKYVRTRVVESEPFRDRLVDLANYCILGDALDQDLKENHGRPQENPAGSIE